MIYNQVPKHKHEASRQEAMKQSKNKSEHPFCDKAIEIITKRLFDNKTRDAIKYALTECFDTETHFSDFEITKMATMIQEEVVCQIRRGEQHPHLKSWGKFQNQKLYEEVRSE